MCHDWGSIVGSAFVEEHEQMVQKYVLMGAPHREIFKKLLRSEMAQFKKSWYMFFFQMPIIPELSMTSLDLIAFDKMFNCRRNDEMTHEYLEAYKYVYSKPGKVFARTQWTVPLQLIYFALCFDIDLQVLLPVELTITVPTFHSVEPKSVEIERAMDRMGCLCWARMINTFRERHWH